MLALGTLLLLIVLWLLSLFDGSDSCQLLFEHLRPALFVQLLQAILGALFNLLGQLLLYLLLFGGLLHRLLERLHQLSELFSQLLFVLLGGVLAAPAQLVHKEVVVKLLHVLIHLSLDLELAHLRVKLLEFGGGLHLHPSAFDVPLHLAF